MSQSDLELALGLLDGLADKPQLDPRSVEQAIHRILQAAGYAVSVPHLGMPDVGIDMEFNGRLAGKDERVGVEVKSHRGAVSGQTISRALTAMHRAGLDRVLVIAPGGYGALARKRAVIEGLGKVDLLDTPDLRSWLQRHRTQDEPPIRTVRSILREAMRDLASRLAVQPDEIYDVEWRDMERLLGEVFERLGFETVVTPSAQDGGLDVRLAAPGGSTYVVEVKHWLTTVGLGVAKRFVEVTAREGAAFGLLLATGGYTNSVFEGVIELTAPVHLGAESKIVSLCKAFYRAETQLWQPDEDLAALLLADTRALQQRAECAGS